MVDPMAVMLEIDATNDAGGALGEFDTQLGDSALIAKAFEEQLAAVNTAAELAEGTLSGLAGTLERMNTALGPMASSMGSIAGGLDTMTEAASLAADAFARLAAAQADAASAGSANSFTGGGVGSLGGVGGASAGIGMSAAEEAQLLAQRASVGANYTIADTYDALAAPWTPAPEPTQAEQKRQNQSDSRYGGGIMQMAKGMLLYQGGYAIMGGIRSMMGAGNALSAAEGTTAAMTGQDSLTNATMQDIIDNAYQGGSSGNDPYNETQQIQQSYAFTSIGMNPALSSKIGKRVMMASSAGGSPDGTADSQAMQALMDAFGLRNGSDAQTYKNAKVLQDQMMVDVQKGAYQFGDMTQGVAMYGELAHGQGISAGDTLAFASLEGLGGVDKGQIAGDTRAFLAAFDKPTPQQQMVAQSLGLGNLSSHFIEDHGGMAGAVEAIHAAAGANGPADEVTNLSGLLGNKAGMAGLSAVIAEMGGSGEFNSVFGAMGDQTKLAGNDKAGATYDAYQVSQSGMAGKLADETAKLQTAFANLGQSLGPLEIALADFTAGLATTLEGVVKDPSKTMSGVLNNIEEQGLAMIPGTAHFGDSSGASAQAWRDTNQLPGVHAAVDVQNQQGLWGKQVGDTFVLDEYQDAMPKTSGGTPIARPLFIPRPGSAGGFLDSYGNTALANRQQHAGSTFGYSGERAGNLSADGATFGGPDIHPDSAAAIAAAQFKPGHYLHLDHQQDVTDSAAAAKADRAAQTAMLLSDGMRGQNTLNMDRTNINTAIKSGSTTEMEATFAQFKADLEAMHVPAKEAASALAVQSSRVAGAENKDQLIASGQLLQTAQLGLQDAQQQHETPAQIRAAFMKTIQVQRDEEGYRLQHKEVTSLAASNFDTSLTQQITAFDANAKANGVQTELTRLNENLALATATQKGLTEAQQALLAAQKAHPAASGMDSTQLTIETTGWAQVAAQTVMQKLGEQLSLANATGHGVGAAQQALVAAQRANPLASGMDATQLATEQAGWSSQATQTQLTKLNENLTLANITGAGISAAQNALVAAQRANPTASGMDATAIQIEQLQWEQAAMRPQVKYIRPNLPTDQLNEAFGGSGSRLSGTNPVHDLMAASLANEQAQLAEAKSQIRYLQNVITVLEANGRESMKQTAYQRAIAAGLARPSGGQAPQLRPGTGHIRG